MFLNRLIPSRAGLSLQLIATGQALPASAVTSEELDVRHARPAGTTYRESGVKSRYLASETETQSELGARALHDALRRATLDVGDIDLLLATCGVQEQALPSTACAIAHHARLNYGTPAFDVNASCLSFLAGLYQAATLLAAGQYRRIAIVASDLPSRGIDWAQPHASSIFGDGAAAVIVGRGGRGRMLAFQFGTYPEGRHACEIRAGGTLRNPRTGDEPSDYLFQMDGRAAFRLASSVLPPILELVLRRVGRPLRDIDTVVPHQASRLAMDHLVSRLGIPTERVVDIYATHGNQVGASLPSALHHAGLGGRLDPGNHILLVGTAAGLSAGAMVLRT